MMASDLKKRGLGRGLSALGLLPDLRRTPLLHTADAFEDVVIGGARKDRGMASFANVMSGEDARAVLPYIIQRANQDKPAGGNVPAPATTER